MCNPAKTGYSNVSKMAFTPFRDFQFLHRNIGNHNLTLRLANQNQAQKSRVSITKSLLGGVTSYGHTNAQPSDCYMFIQFMDYLAKGKNLPLVKS
jgi:hypothetical protein